jgi:hypothetical protein
MKRGLKTQAMGIIKREERNPFIFTSDPFFPPALSLPEPGTVVTPLLRALCSPEREEASWEGGGREPEGKRTAG